MKRHIEWVEKLDGGVKRKVRISFPGRGQVKWQFKRSDEDAWDYDSPPTLDDWEALEEKLSGGYNRRRVPFEMLDLVRKLMKGAGS